MHSNRFRAFAALVFGLLILAACDGDKSRQTYLCGSPVENFAEAQSCADLAFIAFDLVKPWPELGYVYSGDPVLKNPSVLAQADVHPATGRTVIYLTRRLFTGGGQHRPGPDIVAGTIWHEAAHIKAILEHGEAGGRHGPEYHAICDPIAGPRHCAGTI